jgi:hypothetical protein
MPAASLEWPSDESPAPGSFLFSNDEIKEITDEERKKGRYTLANIPKPKLEACLVLLQEKRSFREVARLTGCAWETVQAIANKYAAQIQKAWESIPESLGLTARLGIYRLQANIDSVPAAQLSATIKQVLEVKQLLEGQATSRMEVTVAPRRVSSLEEYEQQIAGLEKKARARMIEAETTHLTGQKNPALAPGQALPVPIDASAEASIEDPDPGRPRDSESDVSRRSAQASDQSATLSSYTSDPESGQIQAQEGTPGGGSIGTIGQAPPWRHHDT